MNIRHVKQLLKVIQLVKGHTRVEIQAYDDKIHSIFSTLRCHFTIKPTSAVLLIIGHPAIIEYIKYLQLALIKAVLSSCSHV